MIIDYVIGVRRARLAAALTIAVAIAGCGGSGDSGPQSTPMSLTIDWPDRGRAVTPPSSALSARIVVRGAGEGGQNLAFVANRSGNASAHEQTYTSPTAGIPGSRTVETQFFAGADGGGDLVGEATFTALIGANGQIPTNVTVDSKIESVEVAASQYVWARTPKNLVATAFDAEHDAVVVRPDAFKWAVTAGETRLRFADGKAEGLLMGSATVTASLDGSISAGVSVEVKPTVEVVSVERGAPKYPFYFGMSGNGQVAFGSYYDVDKSGYLPFSWTEAGGIQPLWTAPILGLAYPGVYASNLDGSIVAGFFSRQNEVEFAWYRGSHGLYYLDPQEYGRTLILGVSNDGAVMVGIQGSGANERAMSLNVLGEITHLQTPGGDSQSGAYRVSQDGTRILGWYMSGGVRRTVVWVNGTAQEVPSPSGQNTYGSALSGDGKVVYGVYGNGERRAAYRWSNEAGFQTLDNGDVYEMNIYSTNFAGDIGIGKRGYGCVWTAEHGTERYEDYLARKYGFAALPGQFGDCGFISSDGMTMSSYYEPTWIIRPVVTD